MKDEQLGQIKSASQKLWVDPVENLIWYLKQVKKLWNDRVDQAEKELKKRKQEITGYENKLD